MAKDDGEKKSKGKKRGSKPAGIQRVRTQLEKIVGNYDRAKGLLTKWHAAEDDNEHLAGLLEQCESMASVLHSMADSCDALADWKPKTLPASARGISGTVTVKDDQVDAYESLGITEGMLLTVSGPSPIRGTIMVKRPDGGQVPITKKHLCQVEAEA